MASQFGLSAPQLKYQSGRETEWDLIQGIHAITNEQIGSSEQKKESNCSHEIIFNYNIKAFQ